MVNSSNQDCVVISYRVWNVTTGKSFSNPDANLLILGHSTTLFLLVGNSLAAATEVLFAIKHNILRKKIFGYMFCFIKSQW